MRIIYLSGAAARTGNSLYNKNGKIYKKEVCWTLKTECQYK